MTSEPGLIETSLRAKEMLKTTALRISNPQSALRMWETLPKKAREFFSKDLEGAYKRYRTYGMWAKLHGVSYERAVIEVGLFLGFLTDIDHDWLLREIGEPTCGEEAVDFAINSSAFVITEKPKTIIWQGKEIEVEWNNYPKLWEFIWELARYGKRGEGVDQNVLEEDTNFKYASKCKDGLRKLPGFPLNLVEQIVPCGPGAQKLTVPPLGIRIFVLDGLETLKEWNP